MNIERCMECAGPETSGAIVWECLPVPCFGKADSSRVKVVTIGLNPSITEFFQDAQAKHAFERLPMLADSEARRRKELTDEACRLARRKRETYFYNNPHPWFTPMQLMLGAMDSGWSYEQGTAVHVDVVACVTNPGYGKLIDSVKAELERNCCRHVTSILAGFREGTLLVINGRGAFHALGAAVEWVSDNRESALPGSPGTKIFDGKVWVDGKRLSYFGWSCNLHRTEMSEAGRIIDHWKRLPVWK